MVLMLYREDMYNEDCDHPGVTDIYIRKHRSGPTSRVSFLPTAFRHFARAQKSWRQPL